MAIECLFLSYSLLKKKYPAYSLGLGILYLANDSYLVSQCLLLIITWEHLVLQGKPVQKSWSWKFDSLYLI